MEDTNHSNKLQSYEGERRKEGRLRRTDKPSPRTNKVGEKSSFYELAGERGIPINENYRQLPRQPSQRVLQKKKSIKGEKNRRIFPSREQIMIGQVCFSLKFPLEGKKGEKSTTSSRKGKKKARP